MSHPNSASLDYPAFFEDQRRKAEQIDSQRVVIAVVVGGALLALLLALGSPWFVYVYVAFLYAITYWGLFRLRTALRVTGLALTDLEKLAQFLATGPRSRDEVKSFIRSQIKPDDSNVPEAVAALSEGSRSGESIRAAGNAAFAQPSSELTLAQFFRTALVLGGLFGTVLFFAFQLDDAALLGGDLSALLPGLRGALASTLTGILGSVALGFVASRIDQIVERSVWETESLLGGPFSQALASHTDDPAAVNEVQLWHMLLREVAELRHSIEERHAAVGNDISAHANALQELSRQLAELPPIQVPPQLARLQDVVSDFRAGMEILHKTSAVLVNAVSQVGIATPIKTLEGLDSLRAEIDAAKRSIRAVADGVSAIQSTTKDLQPSVTSGLTEIREAIRGVERTGRASVEVAERIQRELERASPAIAHIRDELLAAIAEARVSAPAPGPDAQKEERDYDPRDQARSSNDEIHANADQLTPGLQESIADLSPLLHEHNLALSKLSDQLRDLFRPKGPIDQMYKWHKRASRAPLMKFLLLPFRPIREEDARGGA